MFHSGKDRRNKLSVSTHNEVRKASELIIRERPNSVIRVAFYVLFFCSLPVTTLSLKLGEEVIV